MEQATTFRKLYGIPQGIEGDSLEGKWPESQESCSDIKPGSRCIRSLAWGIVYASLFSSQGLCSDIRPLRVKMHKISCMGHED
jgi:hypothetical protein